MRNSPCSLAVRMCAYEERVATRAGSLGYAVSVADAESPVRTRRSLFMGL